MMIYHKDDLLAILKYYEPTNVRTWPYYPITMPLKQGQGPASDEECDEITWEVWDHFCNSHSSHDNLPDAINEAMRLTKEFLG